MNKPIHIRAADPDESVTQANIEHFVYRAHQMDKDEVIGRILQAEGRGKTVISPGPSGLRRDSWRNSTTEAFHAGSVHGDMSQDARERSMAAFKAGKKDVLIATDVAARN